MRPAARALVLTLIGILSACTREAPKPVAVAHPHYLLGGPYEAGGFWYYPAEAGNLDETGFAAVQAAGRAGLTANDETIDDSALTAAMQTLPLPAIVTVTNLQNGLQVQVRVNDRGPADPGRLIALSPRAAQLLQIQDGGTAPVRVAIDAAQTQNLIDQLGGGPKIPIATAARGTVTAEDLTPPGAGGKGAGASRVIGAVNDDAAAPSVPSRLPETLRRVPVSPFQIFINASSFSRAIYAASRAAQLSGLGAVVVSSRDGRETSFAVRAGPFASVAEADRALATAHARGILDARITVDVRNF